MPTRAKIATFVAIAPPAIPISPPIIVTALAALFPVESTDVAIAVAAIPPSIGITIVLRQDGAIFDCVRCAGRAAKREEGTGCKKDCFHFSVSLWWAPTGIAMLVPAGPARNPAP
jgi:hypothetical protein